MAGRVGDLGGDPTAVDVGDAQLAVRRGVFHPNDHPDPGWEAIQVDAVLAGLAGSQQSGDVSDVGGISVGDPAVGGITQDPLFHVAGKGRYQGCDLVVDADAQRIGVATCVEVGSDAPCPAGAVGAHEVVAADVAATLGSGQGPVGVADDGDVVVCVVRPGVTGAHKQGQGFPTKTGSSRLRVRS